MEASAGFDGDAFTVEGDKEDLISPDEGPVIGKAGHVIEARGSIDLQTDKPRGETSPLSHRKKSPTGKDLNTSHGLRIIVGVATGFSLIVTVALIITIYLGHGQVGSSGAVAADVPECSDMGLQILEQGGNAVDAAVTSLLCLGVIDAHSSGIGGGGFMLIHDHKTDAAKVYDFREVAPAAATQSMFSGNPNSKLKGGRAVGVPGELKGLELAHQTYGKLSWSAVVKPAADLARKGYKVTKDMVTAFEKRVDKQDFIGNKLGDIYLTADGHFVAEGTIIKNEDLAHTLDIIMNKGSKAFYDGELTLSIIEAVSQSEGIMTEDDLKNYKVQVRDVVKSTYGDHTLISVPAPGGGPVLLSILNILEGYNLKPDNKNTTETVHRMLEAFKFGYAQQQNLGDPDFESTMTNITFQMLDKANAKELRNKITNVTHLDPAYYRGAVGKLSGKGTSHLSVIDAQELMVSVTSTVNYWFGAKLMTKSGILLNNQMADFADPQDTESSSYKYNYISPGKRPLSSMTPVISYNQDSPCKMRLVVGGANGTRIITGVAEVLLNAVSFGLTMPDAINAPRIHTSLYPGDVEFEGVAEVLLNAVSFGLTMPDAINAPRIHTSLYPGVVEFEDGFPQNVIDDLVKLGHKVTKTSEHLNEIQGIKKVNNRISAVTDYRKGGRAAVFNSNTQ